MTRMFEGSAGEGLADEAVVECGVCWWVYDPAKGDESADIPPGVAFSALPEDWRCPCCDNDKSKFIIRDPGAKAVVAERAGPQPLEARLEDLLTAYKRAEKAMIGLPVHNPSLSVQAVGFEALNDGYAGVVITPWCMNLTYIPADPAASPPGAVGSKRQLVFPSGGYSFLMGHMDGVGVVESCSLFSPMDEFQDQAAAVEAAEAAATALFEVEDAPPPPKVSRRAMFTYKGSPV